jgi:transmembrane serine protease 9
MASLGFFNEETGNYTHNCGATLVSNKHLLTAAHCLDGVQLDKLSAILGTDDLEDTLQRYRVEPYIIKQYIHPKYDPKHAYFDVAILELQPEVEFTNGVLPICLPEVGESNVDHRAGQHVTLTGWGKMTRTDKETSSKMRQAQLGIFGHQHCNSTHNLAGSFLGTIIQQDLPNLFQPNLLCAGYEVSTILAKT